MKPVDRIWLWLIVSLVIAAASRFGPRIYPYDPILLVSVCLSGLWAVIVFVGVIYRRQQGLWLVIGAPWALYVPITLILWERACRLNINACP